MAKRPRFAPLPLQVREGPADTGGMEDDHQPELAAIRRYLAVLVAVALMAGGWFVLHQADTNASARADRMVTELNGR